ncbi:hypothetical protein E4U34_005150 [Claviceps purpurea]|nr:hypothetical protein E4U34_005150 [Claviceps purpurea]KAG6309701.1 hypothetical protein E4U44_006528 [Claviceps purpurea]
MLKNTSVFIAALAAIGTVVQATCTCPKRTCTSGLYYCGSALKNMKYSFLNHYIEDKELYRCGAGNDMKFTKYCYNGCIDAGRGKSDYCR